MRNVNAVITLTITPSALLEFGHGTLGWGLGKKRLPIESGIMGAYITYPQAQTFDFSSKMLDLFAIYCLQVAQQCYKFFRNRDLWYLF